MMLRAVAVLGDGWVRLFDAAAVARLRGAEVIQPLVDDAMLHVRPTRGGTEVRIAHALIRAAVYRQMQWADRRDLHLVAAEVVAHEPAELEHRIAAADGYDDLLADRLECVAANLHSRRSHREAGHHLNIASALTTDPAARERRWLDSLFERALAEDLAPVRAELGEVASARDQARAQLVLATFALMEGRWSDGAHLLEPMVQESAPSPGDGAIRHRAEVLYVWSGLAVGVSTEALAAGLERARGLVDRDEALGGLEQLVAGAVAARRGGPSALLEELRHLPDHPEAVRPDETHALTLRGLARTRQGCLDPAIADMSEVQRRMQTGMTDVGAGAFPSFIAHLGQLHWFRGNWDLARMHLRLAVEVADPVVHPVATAAVTLIESAEGRFADADEHLAQTSMILALMPWQEAFDELLISQVVRLHAGGPAEERAALLASANGVGRESFDNATYLGADPWLVHLALACIWAGELDLAERAVAMMSRERSGDWSAARFWILGLVADERGDRDGAFGHLSAALSDGATAVPLYRAHILGDHARVALALGDRATAQTSLERAGEIYRRLGATPYVERIDAVTTRSQRRAATVALSDRERDVVTLVTSGLSYAQIARELFITQSTVSYHLTNIYAKCNVASRHELTDAIRTDPQLFGLSLAAS